MSNYISDIVAENTAAIVQCNKALEKLLSEVTDLNVKTVNLANKLEDHMKEADAHNPGFMHKKK